MTCVRYGPVSLATRDALRPKLLSGELRIADLTGPRESQA